jgi:CBS domain-containing protein
MPDNRTTAHRSRKLRWWMEDAVPVVGIPAAQTALTLTRARYRDAVRRERDIARRLSPDQTVRQGPFSGLRYVTDVSVSPFLPKLAGTYELEVAEATEELIAATPDVVVDLGSAEGYYAVGLARRLPGARVVAFDTRRSARWLTARMAAANGVTVEVRGTATHSAVQELCDSAERPLVVCDIDGAEDAMIDPAMIPGLRRAAHLIETHDAFVAGVTDRLVDRLSPSHEIQRIAMQPRPPELLPDLPADDARTAMDEHRPDQLWLVARPR